MSYRIDLFDATGARVAILQEAILTTLYLDTSTDAAPSLTLSLPVDDPKSAYISPLYYLKVWNTQTSAYEFSVFKLLNPEIDDSSSTLEIKATYQGILTRLSDEHIEAYDTTSAGAPFADVISDLLAFQVNTPAITVGTLEITPNVAIAIESGNIYSALNSIRDAYGGWFEVDSSYRLNWFADNTAPPQRRIERRKNLKAMTYSPQYDQIINRVYAYGKGETDSRVTLIDAGEANEYIDDAASQTSYGIIARQYINKSITHPTTLLNYAQRILAQYKDPPYQYSVDVINLAEVHGFEYSFESLGLDTRVRVIDDLIHVDVNTSIVSMSINLLNPEEISIELSTIKNDLSDLFGDILNLQDISNSVATQIGAGQVTVLGTFVVQDWVTAGTTTIDGGNITANTITVDQIQAGVLGNKTYRQAAEPASPEEGDIWIDSDDGNLMYRYDGAAWVETQDAEIGDAITAAANAQSTADLRITTFYQTDIPTSLAVGDLWVDTDDDNKLYRAESIGADQITAGEWVIARDAGIGQAISDAAGAQSTADSKVVTFAQAGIPTSTDIGDLWVDTDDHNKLYRAAIIGADQITAGEWELVRDDGIAQALSDASQAISDAATAQGTADGKVTTFYQIGEPTAEGVGDLWVDTDDGNKLYRWSGAAWIEIQDADIASAIADAATAQTTADGKIVSFYQDTAPTAEGEGDLWVDTDDGNKLYRWSGSAWVTVRDVDIAQAISDAATAQATADGKVTTFYQISAPVAEGIGDLWVDTDDGNKLYRWSGSAWVEVQDAGIATAISDAATAQSTADGKIVSFYQDSEPTADGVGDIWFDTDAGNEQYRWSGTAWVKAAVTPAQTVATINLDGGTVQINGSQIEFNGTVGSGDALDSGNYVAATSGWKINGAGDAEFNNVVVRGNLAACTISSGQLLTCNGGIKIIGSSIGTTFMKIADTDTSTEYIEVHKQGIKVYYKGNNEVSIFSDIDARSPISCNIPSGVTTSNSAAFSASSFNPDRAAAFLYMNVDANVEAVRIQSQSTTKNALVVSGGILTDGVTCGGDISCNNLSAVLGITCNTITTDFVYFDDGASFLFESGGNIYWWDGSSSTKLN